MKTCGYSKSTSKSTSIVNILVRKRVLLTFISFVRQNYILFEVNQTEINEE